MKNQLKGFIAGVLVTLLLIGTIGTAAATVGRESATLVYNNIRVILDGKELALANVNGVPVEPFIIGGTTYLPVRGIASALGLDVTWDGASSTVVLTTPEAASPIPTPTRPTAPTDGQLNALASAGKYLSVMPFSYIGLIEQLEYEKYTTEEATFAANNCGADWNKQALKKALQYLDIIPYSRQGLIDQLKYDNFTEKEAAYGADNCQADWNEQAAKRAKAYTEIMSFSRQRLIDQLKHDGFTQSQAEYGVTAIGY